DEAERRVRDKFQELRQSDQSKAQRHIFFAEREAAKVPDLPPETKPREIKRAAVIGAGTMGGGISMCFANAGIPVTIVETSREALGRGLATVSKNYENTVKRGGLKADDMERRVKLMNGTTDIEAVRDATWWSRRCSRRWTSRSRCSPSSTSSLSLTPCSPPTRAISTSTKSPRRRSARRPCSACTSSVRRA